MGNGDSVPQAPPVVPQMLMPVKLAVSPFGPKVPGVPQAHHTSLCIGNLEYSFGPQGIVRNPPFQTHANFTGPMQVTDIGKTDVSGDWLVKVLTNHFTAGSYDLLRKNCNSFSDCALYYTLGKRLDKKYNALEQLAKDVDKMGLVKMVTLGNYEPNPKADSFKLDQVVALARRWHRKVAADSTPRKVSKDASEASPRKVAKTRSAPAGPVGESAQKINHYFVGQRVQVTSKSFDGWVNATVFSMLPDGGVSVKYEGGQFQKDVPRSLMDEHVRNARTQAV